MHIDYRGMLPASNSCDHDNVAFTIDEPKGKNYVLVSVACKNCRVSVNNEQVTKR